MKNLRFVKKIKANPLPISILETPSPLCDYATCERSLSCFDFCYNYVINLITFDLL